MGIFILIKVVMLFTVAAIICGVGIGLYLSVKVVIDKVSESISKYLKKKRWQQNEKFIVVKEWAIEKRTNVLGLTFAERKVYEQEFLFNEPISEPRLLRLEKIYAPEIRVAELIIPVIRAYASAKGGFLLNRLF